MTRLAYAARNFLLTQPSVTELVGADANGPWIFSNRPEATVENSETSLIVVSSTGGWGANQHNEGHFPTLIVDIWSDPSRGAMNAVVSQDAEDKAEAVYLALDKFFHMVDNSAEDGGSVFWGTAEQITNKTGLRIISSTRVGEPDYRPAIDDQGGVVATIRYDVSI